jgi:flagellin
MDNAAGAAISLKFDAQINRLQAAKDNVGNAMSFSQTQDGHLKKVGTALDRMSELAMLALDATKTDTDRALFEKEFDTLQSHITDLSAGTFNGTALFSATALKVTKDSDGGTFDATGIAIGATTDAVAIACVGVDGSDATKNISIRKAGTANTKTDGTTDATFANLALEKVKAAIDKLAEHRATVGASMSRMENTSSNLSVLKDNISAANSRIKDVDVAEESANFARQNILVQSGTAMLAQANALPQSALRLIG